MRPRKSTKAEFKTLTTINKEPINVPISPATDILYRTLGTEGHIERLAGGQEKLLFQTKTNDITGAQAVRIESKKGERSITLELTDIEKLVGNKKGTKKIFLWLLTKINEQAYSVSSDTHQGILRNTDVVFSTKDMVNNGLYSRANTAAVAFDKASDVLTSIKIKGQAIDKKTGKPYVAINDIIVPFIRMTRNGWECAVTLNPALNWGFLLEYYTIIPPYAFALSLKAFDLIYVIFYLARINAKKSKSNNTFTFNINMRTLQRRLGLPSEVGNKNPGRTIIEPIEEAITELEETARQNGEIDFSITPYYDLTGSIKTFLDKGYIKIEIMDRYAKKFIEISEARTKAITKKLEKSQQKEEKSEIAAKTALYKKQLEAEYKRKTQ